MPKIRWDALPTRVKDHLMDRLRIREIDASDMTALLTWIKLNPELPDGPCKEFGTFKLVGEGPIPKTFLTKDLPANDCSDLTLWSVSKNLNRRAHVILPIDVVADTDKLVGKRGRSAFLTELAQREIRSISRCPSCSSCRCRLLGEAIAGMGKRAWPGQPKKVASEFDPGYRRSMGQVKKLDTEDAPRV
jgi:hypothetical protein